MAERRWFKFLILLAAAFFQLAMLSPKQTLLRAEKFKKSKVETVTTEGELDVEVFSPRNFSDNDIPAPLRFLRARENTNDLIQDPTYFGSAEIDLRSLGPYEPKRGTVFYVPYIPIPEEDFSEFLVGSNLSKELKRVLYFTYENQNYVRFFIHPSRTSSYQDLIDHYGIVRDEYVGFLGGSPRSIYTFHPTDKTIRPFQVKASLHFRVNDDLKINYPSKAARSHGVNEFMAAISNYNKNKYNFDFLPESLQLLPRGKGAAVIYREIPEELLASDERVMVPGYFLSSHGPAGEPPLIKTMLKNYRTIEKKIEMAVEVLRPLIRLNVFLMFEEGLKGELHEQNVYFELDEKNLPTGKLLIKDLDSFRVDIELRLRKNKPIDALAELFKPFVYIKFAKASGWGGFGGPIFDQISHEYISHTFGYSFCWVIKCTKKQLKLMYDTINQVAAEEIESITGRPVPQNKIGRPISSWVANVAVEHREHLNTNAPGRPLEEADLKVQKLLLAEYRTLQKLKRTSATLADIDSPNTYFIFHERQNIIEARYIDSRTKKDRSIGFAALRTKKKSNRCQKILEAG